MPEEDVRDLYYAAWERLEQLVLERSKLLHALEAPAQVPLDITSVTGFVIEYDTAAARDVLNAIDELTPRISAAMGELNGYARQIGRKGVEWRKIDLRDV